MITTFRTIQLIFISLVITPTAFGCITLYLFASGFLASAETEDILLYLPATALLFSVPLGNTLYKKMLTGVDPETSINNKLARYQIAVILRAALIELAALLAVVVCFLTGNLLLLTIIPVSWLLFFFVRPTISAMENDMVLSRDEVRQLRGH